MRFKISTKLIVLTCFFWGFSSHPVLGKNMYRLEDGQGNTIFSDQVAPDHTEYQRELLNKEGRPISTTEKAKSKEQQALEDRLTALRKDQEKIIARQKIHDDALLSTFRSAEDISVKLTEKMHEFDSQQTVLEVSLRNAGKLLDDLLKNAAAFERNGQQVPKHDLDNIRSTQQDIEQIKSDIQASVDKRKLSQNEFRADIERYLFLTQSVKKKGSEVVIPNIKEANALGLFYCENDHQCNKAWEISRTFVNLHSTTLPDVFNDRLIMNRPPSKDTDISLSISRIAVTDNDYELFLDIHCRESVVGQQLCASQKIRDIRSSFRPYVNNALSGSAQ
jgi:hypothetical protein